MSIRTNFPIQAHSQRSIASSAKPWFDAIGFTSHVDIARVLAVSSDVGIYLGAVLQHGFICKLARHSLRRQRTTDEGTAKRRGFSRGLPTVKSAP